MMDAALLDEALERNDSGHRLRSMRVLVGLLAPVVTRFLDLNPESPCRETARSLLAAMRGMDDGRRLVLSEREREVLQRLEGQRDKQIAAELGLTVHGVRFHLRKLFTKLNVRTRVEAVRRARELGLIPDDS